MSRIPQTQWNKYIKMLSQINEAAADAMLKKLDTYEGNTDDLIEYAYAVTSQYGNASAALSATMYDIFADIEGATVPPAEMADVPTVHEVAKTVNGVLKTSQNPNEMAGAVSRLVKRTGADTTLKNAQRDHAQFAWVPSGDTCAFCITLASRGWQYMSKNALKNGHAEHIHSNCDCTYAIRFNKNTTIEGYDPKVYQDMYYGAEGKTPEQKINSMRRKFYAENKAIVGPESSKAEEYIVKIDDKFNDRAKNRISILNNLVNEYDSPLSEVINGGRSAKAGEKGWVELGERDKIHLQSPQTNTILHEFAHTLAYKKEDDLGLSDNSDFWRDIAKIRREYNQDVAKDPLKKISAYADSNIDEFMAEAFSLAKLSELGEEIDWKTGLNKNGLPYAQRVLEVINKYFKRK